MCRGAELAVHGAAAVMHQRCTSSSHQQVALQVALGAFQPMARRHQGVGAGVSSDMSSLMSRSRAAKGAPEMEASSWRLGSWNWEAKR